MIKRFILTVVLASATGFAAFAQMDKVVENLETTYDESSPRALGVRIGYGLSVSYQHTLPADHMLSLDLELPGFSGLGIAATYDWLNPFGAHIPWSAAQGCWNWYMGFGLDGGFIFTRSEPYKGGKRTTSGGFFGLAGRVGVEYNFDFPLQLAAEWRPVLGMEFIDTRENYTDTQVHNNRFLYPGFFSSGLIAGALAFCIRYRF